MYIRPAHAGVNPSEEMASPAGNYPPRTCGGEPYASGVCCAGRGSAPHMRGGTKCGTRTELSSLIRPAHAGVNLWGETCGGSFFDPPRTCGGEPHCRTPHLRLQASAPHMRGGTPPLPREKLNTYIRPAHAGVNQQGQSPILLRVDPPRTCGGEPYCYYR